MKRTTEATSRSNSLICGCCGKYFSTWPEYLDQDQDKGYGICQTCQDMIAGKERDEMSKAIATVMNGLRSDQQKQFMEMGRERQEVIVMEVIEKGLLQFVIGGR